MIKKSVITFLVLFILYNCYLFIIKPNDIAPQHQWQANVINAQEYIYGGNKKIVIVGSSCSTRIRSDILSKDYYNLSFGGQGIYEGLEIIKKSGKLPRIILLETNYYLRSPDYDFVNNLFFPVIASARKYFPALLEKNQPMCKGVPFVISGYKKISKIINKVGNKFDVKEKNNRLVFLKANEEKIFRKMLSFHLKEAQTYPHRNNIDESLIRLESYLEYFKNHKIKIVFFDIPIDNKLWTSPYWMRSRFELNTKFSNSLYGHIVISDNDKYKTTDGIHLDAESGEKFTRFLLNQVNLLIGNELGF